MAAEVREEINGGDGGHKIFGMIRRKEEGGKEKGNTLFMNPPIFVGPTNIGGLYPSALPPLYSSVRPCHQRI
jgi:hypothetical protein